MTENIYPTYYELGKSASLLARKAIVRAYEETGNISEVARLFWTTRQTARKVLRRERERDPDKLEYLPKGPKRSSIRTWAAGLILCPFFNLGSFGFFRPGW